MLISNQISYYFFLKNEQNFLPLSKNLFQIRVNCTGESLICVTGKKQRWSQALEQLHLEPQWLRLHPL